jgi:nucleoside-diphosphate-sugar epimerase
MVAETVLVTGGCGFIGLRLVSALKEAGHSVRVLDIARADFTYVEAIGAKVIKGSVTDGETLRIAIGNSHVVYHLAAPDLTITNAAFITKQVVGGADMLMEEVEDTRVRQVVTASTVGVYAHSDNVMSETAPLATGNPFEKAKLEMERSFKRGASIADVNVTCLRLGTVYGKGDGCIVDKLVPRIKDDPDEPVAMPKRGWISTVHVEDVVVAMRSLGAEDRELRMRKKQGEGWFEVLNCIDDMPHTPKGLVEAVATAVRREPPDVVGSGPFRRQDFWAERERTHRVVERCLFSNSKLKSEIDDWPAFGTLEDGLPSELS